VKEERVTKERVMVVYRRELNLALSSSPVTNNNVQFIYWAYCYRVKNLKKILAVHWVSA
jgi:hypothetical protein